MKIGIILHPYGEAKPSGLARTILEWTRGLLAADRENEYLIFVKGNSAQQPDLPGTNWRVVPLGNGRLWLDRLRGAPRADVYLFQTPVLPLRFRPPRAIVIAQDFPYLHLSPADWRDRLRRPILRWYHRRSLRRADAVIAVSDYTRRELVKHFNVPASKITAIPMGFKDICALPQVAVPLPEKFFLFAGVIKARKNVRRAVEAFDEFCRAQPAMPHEFLLAGKDEGAYAAGVRALAHERGIADRVRFADYLNDNQLSYVYRRAEALVFPSVVESFGFPVLEAMACGTPVITSRGQGSGEVAGDAAVLVDPLDAGAIAAGMVRIATDSAFRANLVRAGQRRACAAQFSWERTARETLTFLKGMEGNARN